MATVYGIVRQAGGNVWAYSELGRGTTVKVYLPAWRGEAEPASARPTAAADTRGTETILVVEDQEAVRRIVVQALRGRGYCVIEAESGEEAIQHARQTEGPIQLLVSDVVLGGMTGPQLAERLARTRPEMRVIFTSGYTDSIIAEHGVSAPGAHFLSKPFQPQELCRKVRETLDGPS
jgi:CheY-like chemotaxis protein